MHEPDVAQVVRDRALELLEHSTSGVEAELERARGWLESSHFRVVPNFWEVDAVAGALGSLANVWGRLTMWARGSGTYERVAGELDDVMNQLVELRGRLLSAYPTPADVERLEVLVKRLAAVRDEVRRET